MLCDFKNGVDVVSFLNLSGIFLNFAGSSAKPPAEELFNVAVHSGLQSGLRHNRFPGDPRIKVDLAGLISFYDPELFPSLVDKRRGQERWIHRVGPRILASERASLLRRLEHVLSDSNVGSGIDWTALIRVVVERYADRLEVLQYMLNTTSISESRTEIKNALGDIQEYTTSILTPYLINRVQPGRNSDLDWDQPIFEQCATTHTRFAASARLTRSETLVLGAVEGVLHEICRVVVRMWAEGAMLPLDGDETPLTQVAEKWSWAINELIKWLDWNVWVKCKPACGFEVRPLCLHLLISMLTAHAVGNVLHPDLAVFARTLALCLLDADFGGDAGRIPSTQATLPASSPSLWPHSNVVNHVPCLWRVASVVGLCIFYKVYSPTKFKFFSKLLRAITTRPVAKQTSRWWRIYPSPKLTAIISDPWLPWV